MTDLKTTTLSLSLIALLTGISETQAMTPAFKQQILNQQRAAQLEHECRALELQKQLNYAFRRALWERNPEKARFFLQKGADINAYDERGETALIEQIINGNFDIVLFLLSYYPHINLGMCNLDGLTALQVAERTEQPEIVRLLQKFTRSRL